MKQENTEFKEENNALQGDLLKVNKLLNKTKHNYKLQKQTTENWYRRSKLADKITMKQLQDMSFKDKRGLLDAEVTTRGRQQKPPTIDAEQACEAPQRIEAGSSGSNASKPAVQETDQCGGSKQTLYYRRHHLC